MCRVTPREVIEKYVTAYRAELAAEAETRKSETATKANASPRESAGEPGRATRTSKNERAGKDNRVARCRGMLCKIPPSVEGQNGSDQVYQAARLIWNDFGIDEAEGYPLLQEFNLRSEPVWEEDGKQGLRRKWDEAVAKGPGPERRGYKLKQKSATWEDAPRPVIGQRNRATTDGDRSDGATGKGTETADEMPEVIVNHRQYRDLEADALDALVKANDPPTVFCGNGCGLVDLCRGTPDSPLTARELEPAAMRSIFGQVANWVRLERAKDGSDVYEDDFPPAALLSSFPVRNEWPGIPPLRSVVTYPVFGPGWVLNAAPGYHRESGIFSDLGDLVLPAVPTVPTDEDVAAAKELILTELLGDFPFVGDPEDPTKPNASRANAVAMLILPMIRHAIDGPTPLAVIDAPAEGTGKSLLAEVITLTTIGEVPEAVSPDMDDVEWNKTLLALLIEGQPVVYLDNANKKLDSASFAAALTARWKRGRLLGETKIGRARVSVCWLLTANNFACSREIARRVIWARIDRGVENPADFTGYRHEDILEWAKENRPQLLAAIIVLVNNWLAKGKPRGTAVLGKFETWARSVGGILSAAKIEGFLGNIEELRSRSADQAADMRAFVSGWYTAHASTPVLVKDLYEVAKDTLETVLTGKDDNDRRTQLGKHLSRQRDRVYCGYRITVAMKGGKRDTDHSGRPRYQLQPPSRAEAPPPPPAGPAKPAEYSESDDEFSIKD